MPGKINLYNLGAQGVDTTHSPIHTEDGTLASSQNAVPDIRGEAGGLAKRDGLVAINSTALAGTVKGAIPVAIGEPGSTTTKKVMWVNGNDGSNHSFETTTDSYATLATAIPVTAGYPLEPTRADEFATPFMQETPGVNAIAHKNNLYYIHFDTITIPVPVLFTQYPTLYMYDGRKNSLIVRTVLNPDFTPATDWATVWVPYIITNGSSIFITTLEGDTAERGSVYQISPETGVITRLGATFPVDHIPFCLCWYLGRLWCGTHSGDGDDAIASRIYWIRPGIDSAWTLDHTLTASQGDVLALCEYKGELYAAVHGFTGLPALVKKRTTLGVWSASRTGTQTGASAVGSEYRSLVVHGDYLYAAYANDTTSVQMDAIDRFDGTTWTQVYTTVNGSMFKLYSDGETIFALNSYPTGVTPTSPVKVLTSTNGTSWTDRSTKTNHAALTDLIILNK